MKKPQILAIGANPAWQKVLQFESLCYNAVNRASALWNFASGKGINFARAARNWGAAEVKLLQFAAGENGRLLLEDLKNESLDVKTIAGLSPTRCCITCLGASDSSMTELIEPSGAPGLAAETEALEFIKSYILQADALALCGQLPGGMAPEFYLESVKAASAAGKLILIDCWKDITKVLSAAENALLKINADELAALTGCREITEGVEKLFKSYNLNFAAITNGAEKAYFADNSGNMWRYTVPDVGQVINPVGCGDTASAVLLSELLSGTAPEKAFACALAAASANCLSMKCAEFDRSKAVELLKNTTFERY